MSDENPEQGLPNFELHDAKLQAAFKKHSKKQILQLHELPDLLNDYTEILSYDVSGANDFFSKENPQFPEDYDLDNLSYDQVIHSLKLWANVPMNAEEEQHNEENEAIERNEEQGEQQGEEEPNEEPQEGEQPENREEEEPNNETAQKADEEQEESPEEQKQSRAGRVEDTLAHANEGDEEGQKGSGEDNDTEQIIKIFREFAATNGSSEDEISIELWQDFANTLDKFTEIPRAEVVSQYLKSILDNTYEDERDPRIADILRNIANQNKLTLQDFISLYQESPQTLEDTARIRNKSILDEFLGSSEDFVKETFDEYARSDGNKPSHILHDRLPAFMKDIFTKGGIRLVKRVPANSGKKASELRSNEVDAVLHNFIQEYTPKKSTKYEFAKAVNILYNFSENNESKVDFILVEPPQKAAERLSSRNEPSRVQTLPNETHMETEESNPVEELKKEIRSTIENYERKLSRCKTDDERRIVQNMINSLNSQLAEMEGQSQSKSNKSEKGGDRKNMRSPKRTFAKEEKREKAFKEIFDYYTTEQMMIGKHSTFDNIKNATVLWNVGKLFIFMKDFELFNTELTRAKALELFKKASTNSKTIDFKEFLGIMERYATTFNQKSDQHDTEEKKKEAFYEHIGVYDPAVYRKKMQGVRVAFNSHEKDNFRIPQENMRYQFKVKPHGGKTADEVKEEIKRRNELRNKEKADKLHEKLRDQMAKKNLLEKQKSKRDAAQSYASIQKIAKMPKDEDKSKVTWEKLENLSYADLKGIDQEFKPTDLIEENDEEDQIYLAEYDLNEEKNKKHMERKEAAEATAKKVDDYGKLKPTQPTGKAAQMQSPNKNPNQGYDILRDIEEDYRKGGGRDTPPMRLQKEISPVRPGGGGGPPLRGPQAGSYASQNKYSVLKNNKSMEREDFDELDYRGGYAPDPKMNQKGNKISNQILVRASEIDLERKKKEEKMMKNLMEMQDNQMKKGLKTVAKQPLAKKQSNS